MINDDMQGSYVRHAALQYATEFSNKKLNAGEKIRNRWFLPTITRTEIRTHCRDF